MNCAECQEKLVACAEGLLEPAAAREFQAHLDSCASCAAEFQTISDLRQRLVTRGQASADVDLTFPVMQRVLAERRQRRFEIRKEGFMTKLTRYGIGFGIGAAAVAAILLLSGVFPGSKVQAKAADVLTRGAQAVANLTSVHLKGQARTYPGDNFAAINPNIPFTSIELWKEFRPTLKWRVEKSGRVAVMDGESTLMLMTPSDMAVKLPQATPAAFDTAWLHRIADLSGTIARELKNAQARGSKLVLQDQYGADGRAKSVVTVYVKSGVPDDDYCKNTSMDSADTRRVYRFDSQSELLEAVQVFLITPTGEVQIFELSQIDYNQSIDPETWNLKLPDDVSWAQTQAELPRLPDNDKYSSMTAEDAARTFFDACHREDWTEVGKFFSPVNDRVKEAIGSLEVINVGTAFTSKSYGGKFVPYEIRLRPHEFLVRVSNKNAAGRFVITGLLDGRTNVLQDLPWSNAVAVLPDNATYAALSAADAVKAYFEASGKLNWEEMSKFAPDYDVQNDRDQVETAKKSGVDIVKMMPVREIVDAAPAADGSTWFVRCRESQTKKWNLAVRKDNPVHRWQVDGGF